MNRSWLWSLTGVLAIAAISYGAFIATSAPPVPEGFLYGSGHIEGTEIRVAAEVAGRVLQHNLIEGEKIDAGQTVAVIDPQTSRDQLRVIRGELAALRESRAALEAQVAIWTHCEVSARPCR